MKRAAALLVGLASAALVLGGDRLFSVLSRGGLSPFELAEIRTYDWRLTHTARPASARKDIAIVEIDEPSLRSLQPNAGRWPWPRAVHSMLLDHLSRAPARAIAYDVVFSDPDTRRGFDFGGSTMSGAESDQMLAESVKAGGNVILVADASYDAEVGNLTLPDAGNPLDVPGVYALRGVLPPFKALADAASSLGHNRFVLDPDGPLRHTIPFVRTHHRAVPSLGVSAALRVAGIRLQDVRLDEAETWVCRSEAEAGFSALRPKPFFGSSFVVPSFLSLFASAFLVSLTLVDPVSPAARSSTVAIAVTGVGRIARARRRPGRQRRRQPRDREVAGQRR